MVRERAAKVRPTKYSLKVRFIEGLVAVARAAGDKPTLAVIKTHFQKHPLAEALSEPALKVSRSALIGPARSTPSMPGLAGILLSYGCEVSPSSGPPTASVAGLLLP
jgi:hypothetical protein